MIFDSSGWSLMVGKSEYTKGGRGKLWQADKINRPMVEISGFHGFILVPQSFSAVEWHLVTMFRG